MYSTFALIVGVPVILTLMAIQGLVSHGDYAQGPVLVGVLLGLIFFPGMFWLGRGLPKWGSWLFLGIGVAFLFTVALGQFPQSSFRQSYFFGFTLGAVFGWFIALYTERSQWCTSLSVLRHLALERDDTRSVERIEKLARWVFRFPHLRDYGAEGSDRPNGSR